MKVFKHIRIPADIELESPIKGNASTKHSFWDRVKFLLDADDRFAKTGPGIRAANRLEALFSASRVGDVVALVPDDWKLLLAASEEPSQPWRVFATLDDGRGYAQTVGRKQQPFLDAIADATDDLPALEEAAE